MDLDQTSSSRMAQKQLTSKMSSLASLSARLNKPPPAQTRIVHVQAETVLLAYEAFKKPYKLQKSYLIPKDRAAWLTFLMQTVKKKIPIRYIHDGEFKKVIVKTMPNLQKKLRPILKDRDLPDCVYWTEEEVADWIERIGYPHLKNAFLENYISGKKLIHVDASALNKMGVQDFKQIKRIASKIRELLHLRRPSILRSIARQSPYEKFLKFHSRTGFKYESITFEKFCKEHGFTYHGIRRNKDGIPCIITGHVKGGFDSQSESDQSSDGMSLEGANSVEEIVRHQLVRNRAIQRIIDEVLGRVFDPRRVSAKLEESLDTMIRRILHEALLELGMEDPDLYTRERLEFASGVAERLLKEIMNIIEVMGDKKTFEDHLKNEAQMENVNPEDVQYMHDVAIEFIEEVVPVSVAIALEYYSLDNVFKDQPEIQAYVDDIIEEAEGKRNDLMSIAQDEVRDILSEAKLQVMAQDEFPSMSLESVRNAKKIAQEIVDEVLENAMNIVDFTDIAAEESYGEYEDEREE